LRKPSVAFARTVSPYDNPPCASRTARACRFSTSDHKTNLRGTRLRPPVAGPSGKLRRCPRHQPHPACFRLSTRRAFPVPRPPGCPRPAAHRTGATSSSCNCSITSYPSPLSRCEIPAVPGTFMCAPGPSSPPHSIKQRPEHFLVAGIHIQRQRYYVIDNHMCWQVLCRLLAFPARSSAASTLSLEMFSLLPKADVIRYPNPFRQFIRCFAPIKCPFFSNLRIRLTYNVRGVKP